MAKEFWTPARKWVWGKLIPCFIFGYVVDIVLMTITNSNNNNHTATFLIAWTAIHEIARLKFNLKDHE